MHASPQDQYVFPCKILVSQLSGSGADSLFMGVIKPVEPDPKIIRVWVMPSGTVLCLDQRFLEWWVRCSGCV